MAKFFKSEISSGKLIGLLIGAVLSLAVIIRYLIDWDGVKLAIEGGVLLLYYIVIMWVIPLYIEKRNEKRRS